MNNVTLRNKVKEYRVITTPTFEREVKKLLKRNPRVAEQIEQLLEFLRTDPYNRSGMRDIKKLTDVKEGLPVPTADRRGTMVYPDR